MKEVLDIEPNWRTPATDYPHKKIGTAEIRHKYYAKGFYRMENVDGYTYFKLDERIPVTSLFINNEQWMIDDPLHWIGMQKLAQFSSGRVLVGGLGLGLIVHALLHNSNVTDIVVVDKNPDVIALVKPLIKQVSGCYMTGNKIRYVCDDICRFVGRKKEAFDTIILDIWVLSGDESKEGRTHVWAEMMGAFAYMKQHHPKANIYIWGSTDTAINPAVKEEVKEED